MKELLVTGLVAPLNLKAFLKSKLISSSAYKKLKAEACLMVNGEVIHRNVALSNGDKVTFIIPTEDSTLIPEKDNLRIIYEDDTLLVVDKPAPMLTHPTVQSATGTLANLIAGHYLATSQHCGIHPVSRLDRNTSGLVLFAKNSLYHYLLTQSHITKTYLGIVEGQPTPLSGIITAPISRKPGSIIEREVNFSLGQAAETTYKVLNSNQKFSLVRFVLHTGRTHQIRVHCAYLGCPLVGDNLYGRTGPQTRHCLHAFQLNFVQPFTNSLLSFTSPLPKDMVAMLKQVDLCYNNIV